MIKEFKDAASIKGPYFARIPANLQTKSNLENSRLLFPFNHGYDFCIEYALNLAKGGFCANHRGRFLIFISSFVS